MSSISEVISAKKKQLANSQQPVRLSFLKKMAFLITFCLFFAWGAKILYFALTDGFSIANISSNHPDSPDLEMPSLSAEEAAEVERALSQEFKYFAKGHHSYVFESADKQYVIKFLKFQKFRRNPIINWLPLPSAFHDKHLKRILHKEKKRDTLLMSWKIAITKLKPQTQLLFVHLNRSKPIGKTLTLRNKCGVTYHLNLDNYVFMLQKKVDLLATTFEHHIAHKDMASARQLLDRLLALYELEFRQGVYEEDRCILRNTGVIENCPMHLDVDKFREDENIKEPKQQAAHLIWKTTTLLKWLEERCPELAIYLKESLAERLE